MYEIIFKQKYKHASKWWIKNLFYNIQFGKDRLPKNAEFMDSMISYINLVDISDCDMTHVNEIITNLSTIKI